MTPLAQDKLTWAKDDATFAIKPDGKSIKLVSGEAAGEPVMIKK